MTNFFVHPNALVESQEIGDNTKIWAFAHVMKDVVIGKNCNIGDHVFIESGVRIGNNVTIKNGVAIWEGVEIADNVFIGPNAVFTNDKFPRSPRLEEVKKRYTSKSWLLKTIIEQGVSIGANATILCGIRLGEFCMIGAGSVVTRDIPGLRLAYGIPAKVRGHLSRTGEILK
jgi:acetyltransferase-like isoleucine patch superfamily enzyme